jgi:lipoprotein LprG
MGDVTSVRFEVVPTGAPIYIDQFESIALARIVGEFELGSDADAGGAQAVLDVTVNESLKTQLAAVAVGEEVWLSNPVTGAYESLPPGYDLDPSKFFDPENGWEPLLANLTDVAFVGRETRDGDRYHLTGTAPAAQVSIITAGLVRDQDVDIDVWVQPVTGLVHSLEFTTEIGDGTTDWVVELSGYGEDYDITPPPEAA